MSNGCRDVVRFEPSHFWRGVPGSQHKPVFRFDLTGVALIDTTGKELRLRRENCTIYLFGAGTLSFRRPSPTPPCLGVTFTSTEAVSWCRSGFLIIGIGLLRRSNPVQPSLGTLGDNMSHQDQPVIVGAGPVGLGGALFLARHGQDADSRQ